MTPRPLPEVNAATCDADTLGALLCDHLHQRNTEWHTDLADFRARILDDAKAAAGPAGELTEAEIAEAWEVSRTTLHDVPWHAYSTTVHGRYVAFARAIAARVRPAPLMDGMTEDRARERERAAFRNGWLAYRGVLTCADNLDDAVEEVYPAGAARGGGDEEPWKLLYIDEQAAHKLTAEALTKAIRDGDKADQYRVERDKAVQRAERAEAALADARREGAREALTKVARVADLGANIDGNYTRDFRDREYPAPPAPEPPRVVRPTYIPIVVEFRGGFWQSREDGFCEYHMDNAPRKRIYSREELRDESRTWTREAGTALTAFLAGLDKRAATAGAP